jgi:hypothetical protein
VQASDEPDPVFRLAPRVIAILLLAASAAFGQAPDQNAQIQALTQRLEALEAEVATLRAALLATASPETPTPAEQAPQPLAPVAQVPADPTASQRLMNPAISVVGNLLGAAGENAVDAAQSIEMAETEVAFSAAVDPYARADVYLSFAETGVDVEEAFMTFPAVPGGFLVKAGKQRAAFGKVNTMHRHMLPWADRPLAIGNLLGGEEGLSDAGVTVSRLLPSPGDVFLEASGSVFRGDSEGIFAATRRSDLSAVGHLRGYADLSEESNLDLGFSFARGHAPVEGSPISRLYGVDGTYRWKPLRRSIYHSFSARSEMIWGQRFELGGRSRAFGYYFSGEYQPARRWYVGARYDYSERLDREGHDAGASAIATFWPSEFAQLRAQYRLTNYAEQIRANELLLQLQFAIGAHGAHPF